MTFKDAIASLERKNLAGLVVDGRTARPVCLSPQRLGVIISHVRSALKRATGIIDSRALDEVELRPYLAALPDLARQYAVATGAARPGNYVSDVNTFVRIIEGRAPEQRHYKRRTSTEAFTPPWQQLARALQEHPTEGERYSRYLGWLERLHAVALLNGVRDPRDLPGYATVSEWCAAQGIDDKLRSDLFTAYRKARELAGRPDLPSFEKPAHPSHRGLQSLPDLRTLVEACVTRLNAKLAGKAASRGAEPPAPITAPVDPRSLEPLELLGLMAPEFAKATEMYLRHTETEDPRSEEWRDTVVRAASAFVAELYRMPSTRRIVDGAEVSAPEDPFALDPRRLFAERRLVPARAIQHAEALELGALEDVADVHFDELPLVRLVADAVARRAYASSPLVVPEEQERTEVPLYPPVVWNQLMALWAVTAYVYGDVLRFKEKRSEEWRRIHGAYEDLIAHMRATNASRESRGYKDKTLLTLNWGQALCIGLRELWLRARSQRATWLEAEQRHAPAFSPDGVVTIEARRRVRRECKPVVRARRDYFETLREWTIAAVLLDDVMRIKNYARGIMGVNFRLEFVRDSTGVAQLDAVGRPRIAQVTAEFRGYDRRAGTKRKRNARGAERVRSRTLSPGIVDLELFADFVFELRVEDLVRSGKLASPEAYDPAADHWALFTHAQSKDAMGGYTKARLSKRFGRIIHWMHRDVLRLRDSEGRELPEWKAMQGKSPEAQALRARYRGLFNGHCNRPLAVTFLIGVLDNHIEAMHRTNDSRQVLEDFYAEFRTAVSEAKRNQGILNPTWFRGVVELLIAGKIIDWASFDPRHPELAQVVQAPSAASTAGRGPRRRRTATRRPPAMGAAFGAMVAVQRVTDGLPVAVGPRSSESAGELYSAGRHAQGENAAFRADILHP